MDLQEISDRMEINNLLIDYCTAIDRGDFAQLREIFTAGAQIDYSAMGGAKGNLEEIIAYLEDVMPRFPATQHLIANSRVWIEGDRARARTMCHNPMVYSLPDEQQQTAFYGLWYLDELVRTPQGWRIDQRSEEFGYQHNVPTR